MVSHGGSLDTEIRVVADKALSEQQISLTIMTDGTVIVPYQRNQTPGGGELYFIYFILFIEYICISFPIADFTRQK